MLGLKEVQADISMIPEGTKSVAAQGDSSGWSVVFDTSSGLIKVPVGDMQKAIKLAMKFQSLLHKRKEQN